MATPKKKKKKERKRNPCQYSNLVFRYFPFSILEMLYCLLVCIVSSGKFTFIIIFILLSMVCCFSPASHLLAAFKNFLLSLVLKNLTMLSHMVQFSFCSPLPHSLCTPALVTFFFFCIIERRPQYNTWKKRTQLWATRLTDPVYPAT